jgi:hypothetical protein
VHALASLLLLGSATVPSLTGSWVVNGARLELVQTGDTVVGNLAAAGGPCDVPAGTELLRGSLLDDSLAAQVRLCLVDSKCKDDPGTALAVLLVTTQLTGGVHAQDACAKGVHALTLRKPGTVTAPTLPLPSGNTRLSRTAKPLLRKLDLPAAVRSDRNRQLVHFASESQNGNAAAKTPDADAQVPAPGLRTELGGPDALLLRGMSELQNGRYEPARKLFREALRKQPQSAEACNGVGVTFYARGDFDEALAWYKRAIETDPRFGDAYYNMACLYALQGQKQLALRYLRLAALNRYSEPDQMLTDPDLRSLQGDPQLTELVEQLSLELKPSHPGASQP